MPTPSAAAEGVGTVVSPAWLADAVKEKERRVRVLDCSWYLPAMARDGIEEHAARRIPGARYFDVDATSDPSSALPHMLPSASQFAAACDALDVRNDDQSWCTTAAGLFSARARGGCSRRSDTTPSPCWTAACLHGSKRGCRWTRPPWTMPHVRAAAAAAAVETAIAEKKRRRSFVSAPSSTPRWSLETGRADPGVEREGNAKKERLVDARPEPRWRGAAPEPPGRRAQWPRARVELRPVLLASGRIQTRQVRRSHRGDVLRRGRGLERHVHASGGELRDGRDRVRAGARRRAGRAGAPAERTPVYDGSWTEWGAEDSGCPVETD